VLALAVLTDGRLASGSGDGTVRVWAAEQPGAFGNYAGQLVCNAGCVVRGLAALSSGGFAQARAASTPPPSPPQHATAALSRLTAPTDARHTLLHRHTLQVGNDGCLRVWSATGQEVAKSAAVGSYLFCVAVAKSESVSCRAYTYT
jgi:hypothetical protein